MSYTDMTTSFNYKTHIIWTDYDALAENAKVHYDALNNVMLSAYRAGVQNHPTSFTKLAYDTEDFDTHSDYDNALYTFTPSVAGKYLIIAMDTYNGAVGNPEMWQLMIFKNSGTSSQYSRFNLTLAAETTFNVVSIFDANGSTDYFQIYAQRSFDRTTLGGATNNHFMAIRLPSSN